MPENLRRVDRLVFRYEPNPPPVVTADKELIQRRGRIYARLYVGGEQVALGAVRQTNAHDGEFAVDASGRRLIVMFLQAITGQEFKEQPYDVDQSVSQFHRADLTVRPFRHRKAHRQGDIPA